MGLRGKMNGGIGYEASLYRMIKRDDILSYKDPVTTATISTNAGQTLHQGIEIGVNAALADTLRLDVAYSNAKHTFKDWNAVVAGANVNYTGKEDASAPRVIANARLTYSPGMMNGGNMGLELVSLGSYWQDQANTQKYAGHQLLNLSANYPFDRDWQMFVRLNNATNKRYADSSSLNGVNQVFAPGLPRSGNIGIEAKW